MKKYLIIIMICFMGISNSGCTVVEVLDNMADNQRHAEKISKKLIYYINEKDVDGIEQLFNKFSQKEEKLREDIENFFNYIDGEIVDYNINFRGEVDSWIEDGKWVEQEVQTNIENIITDTGTKYYIVFREYMIYKKDETKEGGCLLTLRDENNHVLFSIFYD